MGLKINGSTSGSIEIDVPAVAGTDTSITIPATSGGEFIVSDSSGNIDLGPLDINGSASDDSVVIDSAGNVGINETSPSTFNDAGTGGVNFVIGASGSGRGVLTFASEQTGGANEPLGIINFVDSDTTNTATRGARIIGHRGSDADTAYLKFETPDSGAPAERMRITSDGITHIGPQSGVADSWASNMYGALSLGGNANTGEQALSVSMMNSTHTAAIMRVSSERSGSSVYDFARYLSDRRYDESSGGDQEFRLRGDGNAYADGSWSGGGADYAEYFEWSDGNTTAEDRRGISVVLDGDKIREAVAGEDPIGVISGNPSVVGDAAWNKWNGKYLRDDFGTYIQEDYEVEDEDGNTVVQQRRKLNPDYNPNTEYVSREDRPEWDCVGLMGKLRIRKGQVTGARWIKMRDISDTVEEWLVR